MAAIVSQEDKKQRGVDDRKTSEKGTDVINRSNSPENRSTGAIETEDTSPNTQPSLQQNVIPASENPEKIASLAREKAIIKSKEQGSRDPRDYKDNILIFLPPPPNYAKYSPKNIDTREAEKRKALLSRSFTDKEMLLKLPLACGQMRHWLEGNGTERRITFTELGLLKKELNFRGYLSGNGSHVERLVQGIRRRMDKGQDDYVPEGKLGVIFYEPSANAIEGKLAGKFLREHLDQLDLFFGLGGYLVGSELQYLYKGKRIEIKQWRVQVYDRYDWDIDEKTAEGGARTVFVFLRTKDFELDFQRAYSNYVTGTLRLPFQYFGDITLVYIDVTFFIEMELAGVGRYFDLFSEIQDITQWKSDFEL